METDRRLFFFFFVRIEIEISMGRRYIEIDQDRHFCFGDRQKCRLSPILNVRSAIFKIFDRRRFQNDLRINCVALHTPQTDSDRFPVYDLARHLAAGRSIDP